jgi:glycosyltransferase involved in cell wall biosynthesis
MQYPIIMDGTKIAFIRIQYSDSRRVDEFIHNLIYEIKNQLPPNYEINLFNFNLTHYNVNSSRYVNINAHDLSSVKTALSTFNNEFDMCVFQHDFFLQNESSNEFIGYLLEKLNIPLITTFHSVRHKPIPDFYEEVISIANRSDYIFVLSKKAKSLLSLIYNIDSDRINIHSYGIQHFPVLNKSVFKKRLQVAEEKSCIFTYGLNSCSKWFELAFRALSELKDSKYQYIIMCNNLSKNEITSLHNLSKAFSVQDNVTILNTPSSSTVLMSYFFAADIFLMPYHNRDELSVDALPLALGSRNAIISTRFWEAEDYLSSKRGLFFEYNSYVSLKNRLFLLIKDDHLRKCFQEESFKFSKFLKWSEISKKYCRIIKNCSLNKQMISEYTS